MSQYRAALAPHLGRRRLFQAKLYAVLPGPNGAERAHGRRVARQELR